MAMHVLDVSGGSSRRTRGAAEHGEYEVSIEEYDVDMGLGAKGSGLSGSCPVGHVRGNGKGKGSDMLEDDDDSDCDDMSLNSSDDTPGTQAELGGGTSHSPCNPRGELSLQSATERTPLPTRSSFLFTSAQQPPMLTRPSIIPRQSSAPTISPFLPDIKIPIPSLRTLSTLTSTEKYHAKALLNSDEELERFVHQLRSEIRRSEMLELALEAERAAEAGKESFSGKASTFVTEDSDDGSQLHTLDAPAASLQHDDSSSGPPSPAPLRASISGYFPSLSPLPPLSGRVHSLPEGRRPMDVRSARVGASNPEVLPHTSLPMSTEKRKIRVLALRDVSEVIPSWSDMHVHMKVHLSLRGVDKECLNVEELSGDKEDQVESSFEVLLGVFSSSTPENEAINVAHKSSASPTNASVGSSGCASDFLAQKPYSFLGNIVQTVMSVSSRDNDEVDDNISTENIQLEEQQLPSEKEKLVSDKLDSFNDAMSNWNGHESNTSISACAGEILSSQTIDGASIRPRAPLLPGLYDIDEEVMLDFVQASPVMTRRASLPSRFLRRLSSCSTPSNASPKLERNQLILGKLKVNGINPMPLLGTIFSNSFSFDDEEEEKKDGDPLVEPPLTFGVKPVALFDCIDDDNGSLLNDQFINKSFFEESSRLTPLSLLVTTSAELNSEGVLLTPQEVNRKERSSGSDFITPTHLRDIRDKDKNTTSQPERVQQPNDETDLTQTPKHVMTVAEPSSIIDSQRSDKEDSFIPLMSALNSLRQHNATRFLALPSIQDTSKDSTDSRTLSFVSDNEVRRRLRYPMRRPSDSLLVNDISSLVDNHVSKSWDDGACRLSDVQDLSISLSLDSPRRPLDSSFNIFEENKLLKDPCHLSRNGFFAPTASYRVSPVVMQPPSSSVERIDDPGSFRTSSSDEERQDIASEIKDNLLPCKSLDEYVPGHVESRRSPCHRTVLSEGCFNSVTEALEKSGSRFALDLSDSRHCQSHFSVGDKKFISLDKLISGAESECGSSVSDKSIDSDTPYSIQSRGLHRITRREVESLPDNSSCASLSDVIKPALSAISDIAISTKGSNSSLLCGGFSETRQNFASAVLSSRIRSNSQKDQFQTALDKFAQLSSSPNRGKSDPSNRVSESVTIDESENNDFLSNYFYCSKLEEIGKDALPDVEVATIACAAPCMGSDQFCDSGMTSICSGVSVLFSADIVSSSLDNTKAKNNEIDGHLSLERDDEVEVLEGESWLGLGLGLFGIFSTRFGLNMVSSLSMRAEKDPIKFQPPGLKKNGTYFPSKLPRTPRANRKVFDSTDHSMHAVHAYNSDSFSEDQFHSMYGMSRHQFLALVDPTRWHAIERVGKRLPHLFPVPVDNFEHQKYSSSSTTNLERTRYVSLPDMPVLNAENLEAHDRSYSAHRRSNMSSWAD